MSQSQNKKQSFSSILRWMGTLSLMASGAVFLFQGLQTVSSFERFLSFGLVTFLLAIFGLFTGTRLQEGRSARTFLGLAAAATPALFAQIGSMIYSTFNAGTGSSVPSAFIVTAPSVLAIAGSVAATLVLLTPILYLGFGSIFRERASQLVLLMLAGSLLLLLPFRNADFAAVLIFIETIALTLFAIKARKKIGTDLEFKAAFLLPYLPVMILIGRQIFYSTSGFLFAAMLLWMGCFFRETAPALAVNESQSRNARNFGTLLLTASWMQAAHAVFAALALDMDLFPMLAIYPALMAYLLGAGSKRTPQNKEAVLFCEVLGFFVPIYSMVHWWDFNSAIFHLIIGIGIAATGYSRKQKAIFWSGNISAGLGLFFSVVKGVVLATNAPWISLAVLGILVIFLAAWLDKNTHQLGQWRNRFQSHFHVSQGLQPQSTRQFTDVAGIPTKVLDK
jgi:hypothetical protein